MHVYPLTDISNKLPEGSAAQISKGDDDGPVFSVTFPNSAYDMTVSQDVIDECEYASLISWKSPYVLKDIKYEYKETDGENVMYITDIKTSLLGNKTSGDSNTTETIEFQDTDKIVYLDKSGDETVLWEKSDS